MVSPSRFMYSAGCVIGCLAIILLSWLYDFVTTQPWTWLGRSVAIATIFILLFEVVGWLHGVFLSLWATLYIASERRHLAEEPEREVPWVTRSQAIDLDHLVQLINDLPDDHLKHDDPYHQDPGQWFKEQLEQDDDDPTR